MTAVLDDAAPLTAPRMGFLSRLGYGLGAMPAGMLLTAIGAQILIAGAQLLLQLIEFRIAEGLPPVTGGLLVGRRGRGPVARLLILGDVPVQTRRHIGGRERAGTEQCRDHPGRLTRAPVKTALSL